MKRLYVFTLLLLSILNNNAAFSADFQKGVEAFHNEDYAGAIKEWAPLAEKGDARAQYDMGLLYHTGLGVELDYQVAIMWYQRAAERQYAPAQFNLGSMYDNGEGVPQDYKTAIKWYLFAAEQGYSPAQYNLGSMYFGGQGVPKINPVAAYMWYSIAASEGNEFAQKTLKEIDTTFPDSIKETATKLKIECIHQAYVDCWNTSAIKKY